MRNPFFSESLRVAIVAPPWYPVPPEGYGGTELVVHLLHTQLRGLGHRVTVFGAEGSGPGVQALAPAAWSEDLGGPLMGLRELSYLARVFERLRGKQFDVLHDHTGPAGVLLALHSGVAPVVVHTMHGQLRPADLAFYREVAETASLVAISDHQASTAGDLRVAGVVHNAVNTQATGASADHDGYLVQIARICPEKGQHLAIEVARRTGRRLILAGKIEPGPVGDAYFHDRIRPHLGPQVEYLPNVAGVEKAQLIGRAAAGIFPLNWPEPFGLALAECMAAGTPVVALRHGAAPELVEEGVTGFLADDADGLAAGVGRLWEIDRLACAARARARFSPERMAEGYLTVYAQSLALAPLPLGEVAGTGTPELQTHTGH